MIGWDVHLKDGRVFSWDESDGILDEHEAIAECTLGPLGIDPADIARVEEIEVVYQQRIDQ